jgi:hypothetical protein
MNIDSPNACCCYPRSVPDDVLTTRPCSPTRRKRYVSECTGLMLALLTCYKSYNFQRNKCDGEEKALTDCTLRQVRIMASTPFLPPPPPPPPPPLLRLLRNGPGI